MKNALLLMLLMLGAAGCASHYHVYTVQISDGNFASVRGNSSTGEAWYMEKSNWVKIKDRKALPKSRYEFSMYPLKNDWGVVRVDTKTGKSWRYSYEKWIEVTN